jgi:hypothetical protein
MILMAINGNGDRDRGRGSSDNGNGRNGENRDNSDRSGRNGADWEVEWIKGMDSEETMSAMVELGKGVMWKISGMRGTVFVFLFFY